MKGDWKPVDVISVCMANGKIRPLRLRLEEDGGLVRVDIEDILDVREIPYVGVEAQIFRCRGRSQGRYIVFDLRYQFRSHTWCLV